MNKHVLIETSCCATMFEHRPIKGRYRCTAAGRYMDTDGRVICAQCATGRVVVKITDAGKLIDLVDQIVASKAPLTDDLRAQLRTLVAIAPEDSP